MKVALITEVSTTHVNGVSRTITKLLDHLIENGHEGMVIGPSNGFYKEKVPLVGTAGLPLFFYPELKLNFALPHVLYQLVRFQPDVIHFADPNLLGPQVLLFCKLFLPAVPIVSSYHTNIAFYAKMFGFSMLYSPIWATHRLYHSPSKYVLCPSRSTKEALAENGIDKDKILIWSRGVDSDLFHPLRRNQNLRNKWIYSHRPEKLKSLYNKASGASTALSIDKTVDRRKHSASSQDEGVSFGLSFPEDKKIILYVGRISWEKNLNILVESFKQMNHEEFHLVVVGDGPAKQTIESELSKTGNATFTGYLKGEALAEAYASADIFAFPSVSETFGQVVLEAQASGLPVVAMEAEGVNEIVVNGKTGLLVNPNNEEKTVIEDYHRAIVSVLNDPETYNSMAKEALKRSKAFTWEAAMNTCLSAYENAITQN